MDFEKNYLDNEPLDIEEESEKPELTKGATRDAAPQYFTNINGIYAKDAAGRAAIEELRYLVDGGYSETVLYTNSDTTTNPATITLSEAYTNFDQLCISTIYTENNTNRIGTELRLVSSYQVGDIMRMFYYDNEVYASYEITDTTTLTKDSDDGGNIIYQIVGIKYGGSNVSTNNYQETVLYTNASANDPETSILLSDSYTNYDSLCICLGKKGSSWLAPYPVCKSLMSNGAQFGLSDEVGYTNAVLTDATHITIQGASSGYGVYKVIGIKYGSNNGGTDDYTTTERKIGKWIDGEDLYQRTFVVTGLVNMQTNNAVLGTSGIDIKAVDGYIEWTLNGEPSPRTCLNYSSSSNYYVVTQIAYTDINIQPYRNNTTTAIFGIPEAVITIKYTKLPAQANVQQSETRNEPIEEEPAEEPVATEEPIEDDMR